MRSMPYVEEGNSRVDLNSRLLKDFIVLVTGPIDDELAELVIAELLYLNSVDPKRPITMHIASGGGSITAGMAIYDCMKLISNPVNTIGMGICASMAAFLVMAGKDCNGIRSMTRNAELMVHQPLCGTNGSVQATDMDLVSNHLARTTLKMLALKAKFSGKTLEEIIEMSTRDNYMYANEALKHNFIDEIIGDSDDKDVDIPVIPTYNITTSGGLENLEKSGLLDDFVKQLGIKIR